VEWLKLKALSSSPNTEKKKMGGGGGRGGEMNQALYAHMNNKRKKKCS
jgi:hypothetical protein